MNKTNLLLIAYSALIFIGGFIGHQVSGSLASLIMSTAFAALILGSLFVAKKYPAIGYKMAYGLISFLSVFFIYRFALTGKFMPPGMLALISLGVIGAMFLIERKPR